MKLYAEKLGDALATQGTEVERARLSDILPRAWQGLPFLEKVDSYAGRFIAYPLLARGLRADIFHIIDHGQGHLLAQLDPARTVVTCHDVILLALAAGRMIGPKPPRVATQVLRYAVGHLRRARWLIADSVHTRRDLMSLVGVDPDRVEVIHPGLSAAFRHAPELRACTRRRWALGDGQLVLHVGHAGFYKNLEGCLRVVAKVRQGGLDVTFVRVGQPLTPDHLALAKELGLRDAIRQLGNVGEEDLVAVYNAADLLLFPSLYEGFGWPPLEAMACGLPVVCSTAGSLGELVGAAALTADPGEVDALAAHVAAVLSDPAVAAGLRARGRARAAQFDWTNAAAETLAVYRRIAGTSC